MTLKLSSRARLLSAKLSLESEAQRGSAAKAVFFFGAFLPDHKHGSGIGDCKDGGGFALKRIKARPRSVQELDRCLCLGQK